ncbi:MAG: hypothetical protein JNM68_17640 [Dinghuibacter sp.]|nr:hypothetical protein [Dinghuibacter sp.]
MTAKKETAKATGKISETGHARNVAAFEAVVTYCKGLGTKYNPVKESLKLDRLTALHQQALLALVNLKIEQPP